MHHRGDTVDTTSLLFHLTGQKPPYTRLQRTMDSAPFNLHETRLRPQQKLPGKQAASPGEASAGDTPGPELGGTALHTASAYVTASHRLSPRAISQVQPNSCQNWPGAPATPLITVPGKDGQDFTASSLFSPSKEPARALAEQRLLLKPCTLPLPYGTDPGGEERQTVYILSIITNYYR